MSRTSIAAFAFVFAAAAAPVAAQSTQSSGTVVYPQPAPAPAPAPQLTAEELRLALELDRRLRYKADDPRTAEERCIDEELDRAGGAASRLEMRVIRLKCSQH